MKIRTIVLLPVFLVAAFNSSGQKKPLDHSVYDGWQSVGEKLISNDGKWVAYTVEVQEGDNELVVQSADGQYRKKFARGYQATITDDSRFLVFRVKPFYKEIREARIKKKKPEEFPKDSVGVLELGTNNIWIKARVRSYKTPQKAGGWLAIQLEKTVEQPRPVSRPATDRKADSLARVIDSLRQVIANYPQPKEKKKKKRDGDELETEEDFDGVHAEGDETSAETGSDLILRNLSNGHEKIFSNILDYAFSSDGGKLVLKKAGNFKDSLRRLSVVLYLPRKDSTIALSRGGNDFKGFAFSEGGDQLAYVGERDSIRNLSKIYRVWYYRDGMDSAGLLVDRNSPGMTLGMTVSEFGTPGFSKSGRRLFFGVAPVQPLKDTAIVEIDVPKLDIWHYQDEYLQTVQTHPTRLRNDQQQNYLTVYDLENQTITQLATRELPQVLPTNEGDGEVFIGMTDFGKRIESQWLGTTLKDIYAVNVRTGERTLVKSDLLGQVYPSSTGKYIMWFDRRAKNYFAWDGNTTKNISAAIRVPLWNEDSQHPEDPPPYGLMGWHQGDSAVYVYDRYDVWKLFPDGKQQPQRLTQGREARLIRRYLQLDPEQRFVRADVPVFFRVVNERTKNSSLEKRKQTAIQLYVQDEPVAINNVVKARRAEAVIFTKENFMQPPDLYYSYAESSGAGDMASSPEVRLARKISAINPQQKDYFWGTAELVKWKAYNGKEATGILYKPENLDPRKKYPMVIYFYEKLSQNLNNYHAPSPIRSAINIPFFVSRGYLIFLPDIHYTVGRPGRDAYDYVVSGARALVKKGFADSTRIGIQGHSWGGYQVAWLVTQTKLFRAAWAGAPVVNMTSAYGGIRWESGVSRQFQYERSQSRLGVSLWDKPQLYIQNSPLFYLKNVTTPLVIMHNDADGAVPWYQGIELFTGLRRLGKQVWMLNYNGQGHGLTQRQDMRDYQIRMQQFFDWKLKGERPARWITEGVPAVHKGRDWGREE
ncbi:MAG TPA: prolyl oligopeptidase family serine peptidase [Chitinophagaceae bacterium]|nr:prolyl oligopeptidase family serine peptidase [Chitinophagaceae bacterium]